MALKITKKTDLKKAIKTVNQFEKGLRSASDDTIGATYNLVSAEMERRNLYDEDTLTEEDLKSIVTKLPMNTLNEFKLIIENEENGRN